MAHVLTSWKEIARYVGKGVRTVQRWEQELGLPVRRPNGGTKSVVLATSEEIDSWIHAQHSCHASQAESEEARLRKVVAELQAENESLRRQLEALQPRASAQLNGEFRPSNPLEMISLVHAIREPTRNAADKGLNPQQKAMLLIEAARRTRSESVRQRSEPKPKISKQS
jgi:hypothetical protein